MKQGDVVIIEFPFSDLTEKKLRPAVVLSNETYNKHKNVVLAGIYGKKQPCSIAITNKDLQSKRLLKESFISLQNIFSIERSLVGKKIDSLVDAKRIETLSTLQKYLS